MTAARFVVAVPGDEAERLLPTTPCDRCGGYGLVESSLPIADIPCPQCYGREPNTPPQQVVVSLRERVPDGSTLQLLTERNERVYTGHGDHEVLTDWVLVGEVHVSECRKSAGFPIGTHNPPKATLANLKGFNGDLPWVAVLDGAERYPIPITDRPCPECEGDGCEYGCGYCESANIGPDSHRIHQRCHGTGRVPWVTLPLHQPTQEGTVAPDDKET